MSMREIMKMVEARPVLPTNPVLSKSVHDFFNQPTIDTGSTHFGSVLQALRRENGEHIKVAFDEMARNRRLELSQQISELDLATNRVQTAWMKIKGRNR